MMHGLGNLKKSHRITLTYLHSFILVIPRPLKFLCIFMDLLNNLWKCNRQSVPKRQHIKFRRCGITLKKTYNIHNTAKVWNQELDLGLVESGNILEGKQGRQHTRTARKKIWSADWSVQNTISKSGTVFHIRNLWSPSNFFSERFC